MSTRQRSSPFLRSTPGAIGIGAVLLTALFMAQDVARSRATGAPMDWLRSLATNGVDWATWAVLALPIVIAGKRLRLDRAGARAAHIALWIALGLVACVTHSLVTGTILYSIGYGPRLPAGLPMPPLHRYLVNWVIGTLGGNTLIYCMIVGVFHAALYYRDLRARELRQIDLEARLTRAELNALRSQLQPHFFFNALHTVSSLMVTDVAAAQRVVSTLGDLLRSSIDHTSRQEIPLRDELGFVAKYTDIQKARFRSRIEVNVDVSPDVLDALVPSFVLQPLVENAIRHGLEPNPRGGSVWIGARRKDGSLELWVRDNGSIDRGDGVVDHANHPPPTAGVGLTNTAARLSQLYGAGSTFDAGWDRDGCFAVRVAMPLRVDTDRTHPAAIA